jgi:uncharacterized protein
MMAHREGSPELDDGPDLDEADALGPAERRQLLEVARQTVRIGLHERTLRLPTPTEVAPALHRPGASFVTLRRNGDLLGCIGSMEPKHPLFEDVARNAYGSAFSDPRLPSVSHHDFVQMSVKISVLGALSPMSVRDLAELASIVRPLVDGLLVMAGMRRGTFLPSVWEQVPDPERFLALLWEKAALAPGSWPDDLEIYRYQTVEFGD